MTDNTINKPYNCYPCDNSDNADLSDSVTSSVAPVLSQIPDVSSSASLSLSQSKGAPSPSFESLTSKTSSNEVSSVWSLGKVVSSVRSMGSSLKTFALAIMLGTTLVSQAHYDLSQTTMTGVSSPEFKTLQLKVNGNDQAVPYIVLGSDDVLTLDFDELSDDRRFLRYRLVQCNADWTPANLNPQEYLSGFNEGYIDDYDFSRATTVPYVHYTVVIPASGDSMSPLVSGNYLLQVYDETDPDTVLLQSRFMVSEQTAKISMADILTRTDIDFQKEHQQLQFEIDYSRAGVSDIYRDTKVVINQNGRLDTERAIPAPMRTSFGKAYYEHSPSLIFEGGNEYRRMETVSTIYPSMRIETTEYHGPYYHAWIETDHPRADQMYQFDRTQNGRFRVREYNSDDPDIEADYIVTHFTLETDRLPGDPTVFLDGDFTMRRFDSDAIMIYNYETGCYEKALLLKQGSYNYQYLVVPYGERRGFTSPIEGDFYNTINEYTIKVYHQNPGDRYQRLICVYTISNR